MEEIYPDNIDDSQSSSDAPKPPPKIQRSRFNVLSLIRSVDAFAVMPLMTHNKKPYYQTIYGGIVSVLIMIATVAYFIIIFTDPWETTESTSSTRLLVANTKHNITYETQFSLTPAFHDKEETQMTYKPFLDGFNIAVSRNPIEPIDPSVYVFMIHYYNGQSEVSANYTMRFCQINDYHPSLEPELTALGVDYWMCLENRSAIEIDYSRPPTFKGFTIGGYECQQVSSECSSSPTYSEISGASLIHWVDAYYDHTNPLTPIKYVLTSGNQYLMDYTTRDFINFELIRNELHDLDGRVTNFWRLQLVTYFSKDGFIGSDFYVTVLLSNEYNLYLQYYAYSSPQSLRNLDTEQVTTKTDKEEVNSKFMFKFLFALSQAGGLYTLLLVIIGLVLSPLITRNFYEDSCEKLVEKNLKMMENVQDCSEDSYDVNFKNMDKETHKRALEEYKNTTTLSSLSAEVNVIDYRMHVLSEKVFNMNTSDIPDMSIHGDKLKSKNKYQSQDLNIDFNRTEKTNDINSSGINLNNIKKENMVQNQIQPFNTKKTTKNGKTNKNNSVLPIQQPESIKPQLKFQQKKQISSSQSYQSHEMASVQAHSPPSDPNTQASAQPSTQQLSQAPSQVPILQPSAQRESQQPSAKLESQQPSSQLKGQQPQPAAQEPQSQPPISQQPTEPLTQQQPSHELSQAPTQPLTQNPSQELLTLLSQQLSQLNIHQLAQLQSQDPNLAHPSTLPLANLLSQAQLSAQPQPPVLPPSQNFIQPPAPAPAPDPSPLQISKDSISQLLDEFNISDIKEENTQPLQEKPSSAQPKKDEMIDDKNKVSSFNF
ncbi:unnamed protein product [Moneuplotes crassus]|uniref:Uncharacterized protein n=1 Tax=Euplotes crassus TaxID=5936 RepID=A0AAD1XV63_EUPCR|nr:unnamed protein product [Moneuplotes crassus]